MEQLRVAYQLPEIPEQEVRELVAQSERQEVKTQCWEDLGYDVIHIDGGGVSIEVESLEESRRTEMICYLRYPYRRDVIQELTTEQLGIHHSWMIEEVIPCVAGLGYEVATAPSFEEFAGTYQQDEPLWFPGEYERDEEERIQDECTLLPPLEAVFPSGS